MVFGRSVFLALLVLLLPLPLRAQGQPADLSRNADAVAQGQRGLEAFRSGDFSAAYALFHGAETIAHSPVFLLYMARARQRQGASDEALDLYARVTREPLVDETPDSWRSAVEQARREAAELQAELARRAEAPPRLLESRHETGTAREALGDREDALDAREDGRGERASRNAAIAAGAIGVAGLALGAVAGLVALTKLNALESRCGEQPCDPAEKSNLESVDTWSRISDLGFVVGGTGLATSAVFLWVVPAASPSAPIRAGVSARMRF